MIVPLLPVSPNPQGSAKIETVSTTQAAAPATSQRMDQKYSQGLVTNSPVATWPVLFLQWIWVIFHLQIVRNQAPLGPTYATTPTSNALSFSGATLQKLPARGSQQDQSLVESQSVRDENKG